MTLHVLHAGDGYAYLTRQVASGDRERGRGEALADYYTANGTPPGRWLGSGTASLAVGGAAAAVSEVAGQVTEDQMKALFGLGIHPNADAIQQAVILAADTGRARQTAPGRAVAASRLGRAFPVYANDNPLRDEVGEAIAGLEREHARPATRAEQKHLWRVVGARMHAEATGREAGSSRELDAWIARQRHADRHPVAGYDLVFTPAKSVSVLWALGDGRVREAVEAAHHDAVADALGWLEREAAFTRRGAGGARQIDTTGLVIAAFDHYDNRAGEPNLHTHCAVSNKVCGSDGRWSALDGATLHRHAVAASQRYNAAVADNLRRALGVGFVERGMGPGRQPVLEVAGISDELREGFSSRTAAVRARRDELAAAYRAEHGYSPDARALYRLAQQATLDTREGKAEARSLAAMREQWRADATGLLGSRDAVEDMLDRVLGGAAASTPREYAGADAEAAAVLDHLSERCATFTAAQVRARAEAHLAPVVFSDPAARRDAIEDTIARALDPRANPVAASAGDRVVALAAPALLEVPDRLRRRDGEAITTRHGETRYTTTASLRAEQALLDATTRATGHATTHVGLVSALADAKRETGRSLNPGQWELARHFCLSGARLAVATGPAGAGKTTAMKVVADAWRGSGRTVIALAPSAVAADTLGAEIGTEAATLASLTYPWRGRIDGVAAGTLARRIEPGTMLLVDEAAMASLHDLAALEQIAAASGAVVRLLGDPAQLDAVETGGTLRLLADHTRAPELADVVRFGDDRAQALASLRLREGHAEALALYDERGWVHGGAREDLAAQAAAAMIADREQGRSSIVLAATREDVRMLNEMLQLALNPAPATGGEAVEQPVATLGDGTTARTGDTIVTRCNDTTLRAVAGTRPGQRVRNGDLWTITAIAEGGTITARSQDHQGSIDLPPAYSAEHVELGYASTIHRAQGITVDTTHALITGHTDRAGLYVAATRGRAANHLYVPTDTDLDIDTEAPHLPPDATEPTTLDRLAVVLGRDGGQRSATEALREALDESEDPARLREAYLAARDQLAADYLDWLIEASLPAATTTTINASPASRDRLRDRLDALSATGHDATALLASAISERDPATAEDPAAALLARLPLPGRIDRDELAPLPPRHPGCDPRLIDHALEARQLLDHPPATAAREPVETDAQVAERLRSSRWRMLDDTELARIAAGRDRDPSLARRAALFGLPTAGAAAARGEQESARARLAGLDEAAAAWDRHDRAATDARSLIAQRDALAAQRDRLAAERDGLGILARSQRRAITDTLGEVGARHDRLARDAAEASARADRLRPTRPRPTTSELDEARAVLQRATRRAAETATATPPGPQDLRPGRGRAARMEAARTEIARREALDPAQRDREDRVRARVAADRQPPVVPGTTAPRGAGRDHGIDD
ncbi:MobF family relaxase [Lolliginicoccus levis]|uniref:MobF family relaxase n=1 Tax=Lolliginicoccus levis TaxID=2919542 RepID=UPI00241F322C|nr:MobF family relaxase [Lolliginicoccus levis]